MAALIAPQNGKARKGRTQKALPSVDLTAMVDLAFLLITFFMLTTSLSKMLAIDIAKPVDGNNIFGEWPESRTMTILLGKNDQVAYFMGSAKKAVMKTTSLASIKAQIIANKAWVAKTHQTFHEKKMLVVIKPTGTSVYKNFVDIIDEMNINGIETYAIDDKYILEEEKFFMQQKSI